MHDGYDRTARRGFSLVELLVVLAVIAIITGISIPILTMFSQNEMDRGARELYSMLKAAQVYAATYHVNTAVIYDLDKGPEDEKNRVEDTVWRGTVRTLRAAAIVYQLPDHLGGYAGKYVPSVKFGGEFRPFKTGYSVLLDVPPESASSPLTRNAYPAIEDEMVATYQTREGRDIGLLGMSAVKVYWDSISPLSSDWLPKAEVDQGSVDYMAHVFQASGRLNAGGDQERYRILFAPSPERPREERMWTTAPLEDDFLTAWFKKELPSGESAGLMGVPIEIYRSTGRIRMGEL